MSLNCSTPAGAGSAFSGAHMDTATVGHITVVEERIITYDNIQYDIGGYIDSLKTKFTIPQNGYYAVGACFGILDNGGTPDPNIYGYTRINGLGRANDGVISLACKPDIWESVVVTQWKLLAGDVIDCRIDARNTIGQDFFYNSSLWIQFLGS